MKKRFQAVVFGTWPYWAGAVILACLNVLILIVRHHPWGITANIEDWDRWIWSFFSSNFKINEYNSPNPYGTIMNAGIILGSFWASLAASQLRWRPIKQPKHYLTALIGGVLVGYGARIAYGCNIGQILNGIASNSLGGWIFAAAALGGAWLGGKIILKLML